MNNNDISILFYDKRLASIFANPQEDATFFGEINALKKAGYNVESTGQFDSNNTKCDILVAHPHLHYISTLRKFHAKNPQVKLIFNSGFVRPKYCSEKTKFGYIKETDGIYVSNDYYIPEEFVLLIDILAKEIRDDRTKIKN